MKKPGDRRQETGDRRQETGDRRQETGDRRQETGDRRYRELWRLSGVRLFLEPACRRVRSMRISFAGPTVQAD
jgi:hypothetical protein